MEKQQPDETTQLLTSKNPNNIQEKHSHRKAVFIILLNKFCQIFTVYGIQVVLFIYLTQVLLYKDDTATVIFHGFMMIYYFSPLFGAFVADVLLGKFKTIVYISVIYLIGNILISMASVPEFLPMGPISILGIMMIAFGIGSSLPCYNAIGGDQYISSQTKEMEIFFFMLFICIHLGKLTSMFLSPILRADVHCFGQSTCFPLAFGFSTILVIFSLITFLIGYPYYKINSPSGNIMFDVIKCITHAVIKKFKMRKMGLKRKHWLDYADDKYDMQLISEVKRLLNVLMIFLPIPIYSALFGQQGSRWTLQATQLNNSVGGYEIKPDQVQIFNPVLSIIIIPSLNYVIYPVFSKCKLLTRPLQRMFIGGLLVSFSFVAAGFLQLSIEKNCTIYGIKDNTNFHIINGVPKNVVAEFQLSDMINKQCHNKGTSLHIGLHNKSINLSQFEKNKTFSLYNNSFPVSRENVDEFFQYASVDYTTLSILLQIPQYFLLTIGELMFSITIVQFAYSQAPINMKTVIQALLFVNIGIGNIIVMIITEMKLFQRQSYEFFFYAILLAVNMLIFALLARNYHYRKQEGY